MRAGFNGGLGRRSGRAGGGEAAGLACSAGVDQLAGVGTGESPPGGAQGWGLAGAVCGVLP
jgi:hypothetical protein